MVNTSACHAEDRGSDPRRNRQFGFVVQWLTRLPVTQKIAGPIPVETAKYGSVAQSVEQRTENPCVDGLIPFGATIYFVSLFPCARSSAG